MLEVLGQDFGGEFFRIFDYEGVSVCRPEVEKRHETVLV
jgi:hypothetical protein